VRNSDDDDDDNNNNNNNKRKAIPVHAMTLLDAVKRPTSRPGLFTPGKQYRYRLNTTLGWTHSWFWRKKTSPLTGIRTLDRPDPIGSLHRLHYPGPYNNNSNNNNNNNNNNNIIVISPTEYVNLFENRFPQPTLVLSCRLGWYTYQTTSAFLPLRTYFH
jgi:hypothetical protein